MPTSALPAGAVLPGVGTANGSGGFSGPTNAPAPAPVYNANAKMPSPNAPGGLITPNTDGTFSPPPATGATKTSQPTVLSSSNIDDVNQSNMSQLSTTPAAGQTVENGFAINADRSFASAPASATQTTDADGNTYWTSGGVNYALGPSDGNVSDDPATQASYDALTTLKSQMDATSAATIGNIQGQYAGLIAAQTQINASDAAKTNTLLLRGNSMQTASGNGILQAQISAGIGTIADLNTKEQTAILAAQTAAQNNDMKVLDEQLTIANTARTDKQAAAQKLSDTITTATAQTKVDASVADLIAKGFTDPSTIYSMLQAQGYTNVTSAQVATSVKNLTASTAEKDKTSTVVVNGRRLLIDDTTGATIQDLGVATGTVSLSGKSGSTKTIANAPTGYTEADQSDDDAYLKSHEGPDGYVDPAAYQAAYNTWTTQGGTTTGFLKAFPPKDYVNPANTTLPSYLRSSTKSSTSPTTTASDSNPFG